MTANKLLLREGDDVLIQIERPIRYLYPADFITNDNPAALFKIRLKSSVEFQWWAAADDYPRGRIITRAPGAEVHIFSIVGRWWVAWSSPLTRLVTPAPVLALFP